MLVSEHDSHARGLLMPWGTASGQHLGLIRDDLPPAFSVECMESVLLSPLESIELFLSSFLGLLS